MQKDKKLNFLIWMHLSTEIQLLACIKEVQNKEREQGEKYIYIFLFTKSVKHLAGTR